MKQFNMDDYNALKALPLLRDLQEQNRCVSTA